MNEEWWEKPIEFTLEQWEQIFDLMEKGGSPTVLISKIDYREANLEEIKRMFGRREENEKD